MKQLVFLMALLAALPLLAVRAAQAPPEAMPSWVEEARFVGDDMCAACHADQIEAMAGQIHTRIRSWEVRGKQVGCEGCHGPGSLHAESTDPELVRSFGPYGAGDAACMACHQTKGLPQWHGSPHALSGVGCIDCHSIHTASDPFDSCQSCHGDQVAQFQLPSHHPVREGRMSCASCHDVHSARPQMLRTSERLNSLCHDCHQAIEGPHVFEHAPVVEGCDNCHRPHGSVANNLLAMNEPALCLQCHELHFHAGYRGSTQHEVDIGGFERENPFGTAGMNIAFTTSCTQCHTRVHGSDLPSQSVTSRGESLMQ